MSYEMTKMLSLLAYPLSQSLLLCLLGLLLFVLRRPRGAAGAVLLATTWLWLCSTNLFADFLMGTLEEGFPPRAISATPQAGAIVLLGGAIRGDTHMSTLGDLNQQADRLVHAVALYKAGKAPLILVTGGAQTGERPEAEIMRDLLVVMGVPAHAILLERASRDTHQNAENSVVLLENRGIGSILLVTSAFHMRRAQALFTGRGVEVIPAPTDYQRLVVAPVMPSWLPAAEDLVRSTYALREYVGYWVYHYRGWL